MTSFPTIGHAGILPTVPSLLPNSEPERRPNKAALLNIYIVVLTAVIFFVILSWYTFILQFYRYFTRYNSEMPQENVKILKKNALSSFGFALLITVIALIIYGLFVGLGKVKSGASSEPSKFGPPRPDEVSMK